MKVFKSSLSLVIFPFFLSGMDVCRGGDGGLEEASNALLGTVRSIRSGRDVFRVCPIVSILCEDEKIFVIITGCM
jgi:hypothetical protein